MSKTILKTLVKSRARLAKNKEGFGYVDDAESLCSTLRFKVKNAQVGLDSAKLLSSVLGLFNQDWLENYFWGLIYKEDFDQYDHQLGLHIYDLAIEMAAAAEV